MTYDGEYRTDEYPDGIHAPRLGYRASREMSDLRQAKDAEIQRLRSMLERLRSCAHACIPPCPHSRRFDEITSGVWVGDQRGSR